MCYPKNPSFCLMCKAGYTHDSDGICNLTEPLPPPEPPSSIYLIKVYQFISFIIFINFISHY